MKPGSLWEYVSTQDRFKPEFKKLVSSISIKEIEVFYCTQEQQYEASGISVLFLYDAEYPEYLRQIDEPPLFLFCKGDKTLLAVQGVAVVGTRNITAYGRMVTEKITREVVADGFTTISGCMYGVDELVHTSTIQNGGKTVAVLGYGFEHTYPVRMSTVLNHILLHGGLLVSEYFPHQRSHRAFFLARNRIIAGLCHSLVVTEAAQRSGSHSTAVCAAASGRAVFAVPGPITNPYSEGTKWLVNQGATLLTSGYEIAEYLGKNASLKSPVVGKSQELVSKKVTGLTLSEQLLASISSGPTTIETLVLETGESISAVLVALSKLELEARVVKDGILWYPREGY